MPDAQPRSAASLPARRYRFRLGRAARLLLLWGVRPATAYVDLDGSSVDIRFGPWRMRTTLANIVGFELTGPYRWWRAIGVRSSVRGGDVTFGSTADGGVCLRFVRPMRWLRVFHPPAVTVTLDDLDGFATALRALGVEGHDRRTR